MTRALAFSCCFALAACGRTGASTTATTPVQPIDVPRIDAGSPAPLPGPHATGEVTVSVLSRDGGHWGTFIELTPDPTAAVRPCATRALASDPTITGWALFDVAIPNGYASAKLAEASALPKPFLECVEHALSELRTVVDGRGVGATLFYVTLR